MASGGSFPPHLEIANLSRFILFGCRFSLDFLLLRNLYLELPLPDFSCPLLSLSSDFESARINADTGTKSWWGSWYPRLFLQTSWTSRVLEWVDSYSETRALFQPDKWVSSRNHTPHFSSFSRSSCIPRMKRMATWRRILRERSTIMKRLITISKRRKTQESGVKGTYRDGGHYRIESKRRDQCKRMWEWCRDSDICVSSSTSGDRCHICSTEQLIAFKFRSYWADLPCLAQSERCARLAGLWAILYLINAWMDEGKPHQLLLSGGCSCPCLRWGEGVQTG